MQLCCDLLEYNLVSYVSHTQVLLIFKTAGCTICKNIYSYAHSVLDDVSGTELWQYL